MVGIFRYNILLSVEKCKIDKQKILIVDDEASITNLVSAYLKPEGYEIQVELGVAVPPDLPSVLIDEDRIGRVLLNIVGNALHHTLHGGG